MMLEEASMLLATFIRRLHCHDIVLGSLDIRGLQARYLPAQATGEHELFRSDRRRKVN